MDRFERSYLELKAAMPTTEIPQELRAIIVLDGASVEGLEETVLLGKVNMDDKTTLLSQMEKALKDVLGRGPCGKGRGTGTGGDGLVRVEAVKKKRRGILPMGWRPEVQSCEEESKEQERGRR